MFDAARAPLGSNKVPAAPMTESLASFSLDHPATLAFTTKQGGVSTASFISSGLILSYSLMRVAHDVPSAHLGASDRGGRLLI